MVCLRENSAKESRFTCLRCAYMWPLSLRVLRFLDAFWGEIFHTKWAYASKLVMRRHGWVRDYASRMPWELVCFVSDMASCEHSSNMDEAWLWSVEGGRMKECYAACCNERASDIIKVIIIVKLLSLAECPWRRHTPQVFYLREKHSRNLHELVWTFAITTIRQDMNWNICCAHAWRTKEEHI